MPIEVRHGMDPAIVAAIASAAGAASALRIPQMPQISAGGLHFSVPSGGGRGSRGDRSAGRFDIGSRSIGRSDELLAAAEMQEKEIEAEAALKKAASEEAIKKTAIEHGLDKELQEMEFDQRLKLTQEQAKAKAMKFDFVFTPKQRQQIGWYQQKIQERQNSDDPPEQKQQAISKLMTGMAGIQPVAIPREGPTYPDWFDPNGVSTDPNTGLMYTPDYRNGQVVPRAVDKSLQPSYQKHELEKKRMELVAKQETEWSKREWEYVNAPVIEEEGERAPTRQEVVRRMASFKDLKWNLQGRPAPQQAPQKPPKTGRQDKPQGWWSQAESAGVKVTEAERKLPEQVGRASAWYRLAAKEYGDGKRVDYARLPDALKPMYKQVIQAMNDYYGGK